MLDSRIPTPQSSDIQNLRYFEIPKLGSADRVYHDKSYIVVDTETNTFRYVRFKPPMMLESPELQHAFNKYYKDIAKIDDKRLNVLIRTGIKDFYEFTIQLNRELDIEQFHDIMVKAGEENGETPDDEMYLQRRG